ncbi:MAG: fimbrial protein [Stenotrophomonas sp.]
MFASDAAAVSCSLSTGVPSPFSMVPQKTDIKINPDVADGTVLVRLSQLASFMGGPKAEVRCGSLKTIDTQWQLTTGAYLGNNTYESGMPGIGLRAYHRATRPFDTYLETESLPASWTNSITVDIEFVKIGPITGKMALGGMIGQVAIPTADNLVWKTLTLTRDIVIDSGKPTCSVTTPSMSVPMMPAHKHVFTGVGAVSDARTFHLGVNCAGGDVGARVAVYGVLTDQSRPDNRSDALFLSQDSTAEGVGVQILLDDRVLKYGPDSAATNVENRWFAGSTGSTGSGDFTIPLSARYVQTQPTVKPGSANARATFTLSYE